MCNNPFPCLPKPLFKTLKLWGSSFKLSVNLIAVLVNSLVFLQSFVSCIKLRHEDPEDKLSALVTSQHVHFIRAGLPLAENVVLTVKLFNLYKARHKDQGMWYCMCVIYGLQLRGLSGNGRGKKTLFKVSEKSGNFILSEGNLTFWRKVRRCWHNLRQVIALYIISKWMHTLWLVNQLWFIMPLNPWKNRAFSELL